MKCYIDFFYNDNNELNAEIHKQGKYKIVKNKKHVDKLIEIANKHGYIITDECRLEDKVITITREFDKYIEKQKRKLRIFGPIYNNMKISHENKVKGKKIVVGSLIAFLTVAGITNLKSNADEKEQQTIVTEIDQKETPLEEIIHETTSHIEERTTENKKPVEIKEKTEKQKTTELKHKNSEMDKIFIEETFHFYYDKSPNMSKFRNARRYKDIFEKYSKMYGVDKNLLIAVAAQESSGDHYNNLDNGPACGIMQIEKDVHIDTRLSAYNFNTKEVETFKITNDNIRDLDTNIKIGTMILRNYIENNNYNIPLSLQTYNFGPGNMTKSLNACSYDKNISVEEMSSNPTSNQWLNYRSFLNTGDPEYIEHVFSYLDNDTQITVLDRNSNEIRIKIKNDYKKSKQK